MYTPYIGYAGILLDIIIIRKVNYVKIKSIDLSNIIIYYYNIIHLIIEISR